MAALGQEPAKSSCRAGPGKPRRVFPDMDCNLVKDGQQRPFWRPMKGLPGTGGIHHHPRNIERPGPAIRRRNVRSKPLITPCGQLRERHGVCQSSTGIVNGIRRRLRLHLNANKIR